MSLAEQLKVKSIPTELPTVDSSLPVEGDTNSRIPFQTEASHPLARTRWSRSINGCELVESDGTAIVRQLHKQLSELAELTLKTQQRQTKLLASSGGKLLVAEPIPTRQEQCIVEVFDLSISDLSSVSLGEQMNAIEDLTRLAGASSGEIQGSRDSKPDASVGTISTELTWKEIGYAIASKIKSRLITWRSKAKVTVFVAAMLGVMAFIPWPYRIQCKAICEPTTRRFVAVPFDGRLENVIVKLGDRVSEGQPLATLDGSDLRSQIAGVEAKLGQAQQRQLAALSSGDHSKAEFERLEVEHAKREHELLTRRLAALEVRSPVDGIILTGDLERAQGAPVKVGDNLFEIASIDSLVAEIAVQESNVNDVSPGMPVTLNFAACPNESFKSTIARVNPRSEMRDNECVFIVEANMLNEHCVLRPGMNADVTIDLGNRSIGWQLFHRPYEAFMLWIGW